MLVAILRRLGIKAHGFDYRNPASRSCRYCGLHQNFYSPGGWMVMFPLPNDPKMCWGNEPQQADDHVLEYYHYLKYWGS